MSAGDIAGQAPAAARAAVAAAAGGRGKSVYLIWGEALPVGAAAAALVDALVPAERRSMNLEVYDGRVTPLPTVLDSARTPGFFGGTKLIWVRDAPVFAPAERRGDAVTKIVEAAEDGRMDAAASRILPLLAAADWSQEDLDTRRLGELSRAKVTQAFGEGLTTDALGALDGVLTWARERGMRLAAAADTGEALLQVVESGLPPGVVLLFTGASVDRRKRVVKRLGEIGEVIELSVERDRTGALTADSADAVIERVVAAHGKRLAPAARERLRQRAGGDAGALAHEVEKLCLFVGEATTIDPADVDAAVRDLGDAWIFDLTDALANRDARRALPVLRGLLERGDHPLRLLATLHSHVRLLLILRECLDGPWRGRWRPGTRADGFARSLLPLLSEEEQAVLKGVHPYRLAVNAGQAARLAAARLRRAVADLAALDVKFKSSRGDPAILLERFVLELCR